MIEATADRVAGYPLKAASWRKRRSVVFLRTLFRPMQGKLGVIIILLMLGIALAAPLLAPYSPFQPAYPERLQGPTATHLMGTDETGRDVFSRVLYGSRISLRVGIIAVTIALAIGVTAGLVAGYYRGIVDTLIMRVVESCSPSPASCWRWRLSPCSDQACATQCSPSASAPPPGSPGWCAGRCCRSARPITSWRPRWSAPRPGRSCDGMCCRMRCRRLLYWRRSNYRPPFWSPPASRSSGWALNRHRPNGARCSSTVTIYIQTAWWLITFPGIAIFITVLGFNLFGNALQDALNPRLRQR